MKASRASASKKKHQCCISSEFPTKQLSLAEATKLKQGTNLHVHPTRKSHFVDISTFVFNKL